ncbi:MAG TPA: hypothetical protein VKW76_15160 [Candidatus Binatia bacterium]|nr:hypothetical protein [Candidatus Binatia bacterium]
MGGWRCAAARLATFWDPDAERAAAGVGRVALLAFGVLLARRPSVLRSPQLWAEDGTVFFHDELVWGFRRAVLRPYAGYVLVTPRAVAGLLAFLPVRATAWCYAVFSLIVGAVACAWFARAEYRRVVSDDGTRAAMCLATAAVATGGEIIGNLCNVQWYLLWLGYLLILAPLPRGSWGKAGYVAAWWAIGLCTPGALALAPLWILRLILRPARGERLCGALCLLPSLLLVGLLDWPTIGASQLQAPAATAGQMLHLLGWRVLGEAFVGEYDPLRLVKRFGTAVPAAAAGLIAVAAWVVVARGTPRQRAWLVLSATALSVYAFMVVRGRPDIVVNWHHKGGGRFFVFPADFVVMLFVVCAGVLPWPRRLALAPVLAMLTVASALAFQYPALVDLHWSRFGAALDAAMARRLTCDVAIPLNPPSPAWVLRLRLDRGRPAALPADAAPAPVCPPAPPRQARR